jgi:hypothetical protein
VESVWGREMAECCKIVLGITSLPHRPVAPCLSAARHFVCHYLA